MARTDVRQRKSSLVAPYQLRHSMTPVEKRWQMAAAEFIKGDITHNRERILLEAGRVSIDKPRYLRYTCKWLILNQIFNYISWRCGQATIVLKSAKQGTLVVEHYAHVIDLHWFHGRLRSCSDAQAYKYPPSVRVAHKLTVDAST